MNSLNREAVANEVANAMNACLAMINHPLRFCASDDIPFAASGRIIALEDGGVIREAGDTDARIKQAAVALAVATVASCDCDTKSPNPEHHSSLCTYASLRMAMARVDQIIERRASALTVPGLGGDQGEEGDMASVAESALAVHAASTETEGH